MKNQLLAAVLLTSALTLSHADTQPLRASSVPVRTDAPVLFAPRGWKIEQTVRGNLNADKLSDAALVLVENKPAKDASGDPTPRRRALIVLLREGKGWHRVGFNGELLSGTRDGGAFYGVVEAPVNVSIKRSTIIINMEAGSREVSNATHKLRYQPKSKAVYLIGLDTTTNDRLTGDVISTSSNFLTGFKKTKTIKGSNDRESTRTKRISKKLRSLESLKESDRFAD